MKFLDRTKDFKKEWITEAKIRKRLKNFFNLIFFYRDVDCIEKIKTGFVQAIKKKLKNHFKSNNFLIVLKKKLSK